MRAPYAGGIAAMPARPGYAPTDTPDRTGTDEARGATPALDV
jgi:hypothetical protein